MNSANFGMPELIVILVMGISLAWYVGVIVLLFRIWNKVKRLPG
jgi:hypothetical protein